MRPINGNYNDNDDYDERNRSDDDDIDDNDGTLAHVASNVSLNSIQHFLASFSKLKTFHQRQMFSDAVKTAKSSITSFCNSYFT